MKRRLDQNVLDALLQSSLWNGKLKADCQKGEVMLAIRDNRIDFYHKGGKLFGFDGKDFKTHIKYASVIDADNEKDNYVTAEKLSKCTISNFEDRYDQIKKNCALYAGVEAEGVAMICKEHSYLLLDKNIVVLDIEISFKSEDEDKSQNRIDLLLFNKMTGVLQFVEAKHFSNSEIWSNTTPKVIKQIERYNKQIQGKGAKIIKEYTEYVNIINQIFGVNLPYPISISENVLLFVFGFDNDQKYGKLKKLITDNDIFKDICHSKGNVKKLGLKGFF